MYESCPLLAAPMTALAPLKLAPTLSLIMRRLGADDLAARRRRGSEGFGPLEPEAPVLRACARACGRAEPSESWRSQTPGFAGRDASQGLSRGSRSSGLAAFA